MPNLRAARTLLMLRLVSFCQSQFTDSSAADISSATYNSLVVYQPSIAYSINQNNAVKSFHIAAYDTNDRPTVTTQVMIDNATATVVIGPYKEVHMITAAPLIKRDPNNSGDHGEPDSDEPGPPPPSPPDCDPNPDAPIPDPTPIPDDPRGQGGSPYVQGVCTLHLTEWYTGIHKDHHLFSLEILIKDAAGNQVGWHVRTNADASQPLHVKSKFEDELVLTPEEEHSYIQFNLGSQAWASNAKSGPNDVPSCQVGGYDKRHSRQMDCKFTCTWGGGKSSDGS